MKAWDPLIAVLTVFAIFFVKTFEVFLKRVFCLESIYYDIVESIFKPVFCYFLEQL